MRLIAPYIELARSMRAEERRADINAAATGSGRDVFPALAARTVRNNREARDVKKKRKRPKEPEAEAYGLKPGVSTQDKDDDE